MLNSYFFGSKIFFGDIMRLSTKGRYALTIMLDIASTYEKKDFISLNDIAQKENISYKYLEKIMNNLKKYDFFITSRGSLGGYQLKYSPDHYRIGDIIEAAEESMDVVSCTSEGNLCPKSQNCRTYPLWKGLSDEIHNYLNSKTLADYL